MLKNVELRKVDRNDRMLVSSELGSIMGAAEKRDEMVRHFNTDLV